ncbi:selenoprotein F [Leptinotarsa decemlineata]|uniref:selenoprotein F n=1 Tax=Leptinotarsa decemlineata TaxID=7539 RepID=UPI000C252804|nr:selenoprotein F [Leptinotarsa decemlineata]XP_023018476.1 selenoprotein F [Leptinotarsa decemlineata]
MYIVKSIFIILFVNLVLAEFSTEDCWSLGLHKANLLCSSCDQLPRFNLTELMSHCKECCRQDDVGPTEKTYHKAVLEVCTCKFGAYPQIQAFIKSHRPSLFPNLQIKYVRGLDPIIKLYDKDGHLQETVAIEKWNTDSVEEFLNTHLDKIDDEDYLRTNMV